MITVAYFALIPWKNLVQPESDKVTELTWVSVDRLGAGESRSVRVDLEKGAALPYPRLRVGRDTICVGMSDVPRHEPGGVAAAFQSAIEQAFELLTGEHGMEPAVAYAYASARVDMRLGGPAGALVLAVVPDPETA